MATTCLLGFAIVKQYEHGFPDEDTARRILAVKVGEVADGRGGLKTPKPSGPPGRPTIVKKTLFLERQKDIACLYQALPAPFNVAFAISALAGLRPGEVRALKWSNVESEHRRIHGVTGSAVMWSSVTIVVRRALAMAPVTR